MRTTESRLLPVAVLFLAVHTICAAKGLVLFTSSGLKMQDISNGNVTTIISGSVNTGCFSPDGKRVAYSIGSSIYTASLNGSGQKKLSGSITTAEPSLTWTNSDWIYYSKGTTIYRSHATSGDAEEVMDVNLNWTDDRIRTISVSMDGKRAASWGRPNNDGHAIRYDLVNKKVVEAVGDRCNAHVSPDGSLFNRLHADHHTVLIYQWGSKSKVKNLYSGGRIGNNWGGWSNHDNNVFMYDGKVVTIDDDNRIASVSGTAWDYYPDGGGDTPPPSSTSIISGPSDGATLNAGASYGFGGDGTGLVWTYDIAGDGQLAQQFGTGSNASLTVPTGLSDGATLIVELSGDGGSDSRTYTVTTETASCPTATAITQPSDGYAFVEGTSVTLNGEGCNLQWEYDAVSDGELKVSIGTGSSVSFAVPTGISGARTITIYLTGDNGVDSIGGTITTDATVMGRPALQRAPAAGLGKSACVKLYRIDGTLVGIYDGVGVKKAMAQLPAGFYCVQSSGGSKLIRASVGVGPDECQQ